MSSAWSTPNQDSRKRNRDSEDNFTPDSSRRRYNNDNRSQQTQHHRRDRGPRRSHPHQNTTGPNGNDIVDQFLNTVWRLGDSDRFDFRREIPETVHLIEQHFRHWPADVLTAFRIATVELPHKLPHYALLIALLSTPPVTKPTETPIGLQVIRELGRAFQQHIDNRRWRSTRLCVQLFGQLNSLQRPLVSDRSLLAILQAFVRVLSDELTCSISRADECVRIATEGLVRSGLWVRFGPNSENHLKTLNSGEEPKTIDTSNGAHQAIKSDGEDKAMDIDPSNTQGDDSTATKTEKSDLGESKELESDEQRAITGDQSADLTKDSKTGDLDTTKPDKTLSPEEEAERAKEVADIKNGVTQLVDSIKSHMSNRKIDRSLFNQATALSQYTDPIEELVAALDEPTISVLPILDSPFSPLIEARMKPYSGVDVQYPSPVDLPVVLLPPENDDDDLEERPVVSVNVTAHHHSSNSAAPGRPLSADSKDRIGYTGVRMFLKMFVDNSVPSRNTADGVVLRTLIHDIIDIFEVNRKECAKILLELPRWVGRGTFKSKATKDVVEKDGGPGWVLEHTIIETIVSSIFGMPRSPIKPSVYYSSLIAELCKLSPSTVAPALGKCMRRLFGGLGAKKDTTDDEENNTIIVLDAEAIRRFADWFAVHLSNFGFLWVWKDWTEVTELEVDHPKRVLVSRILELEIRLSYYDRIVGTVPASYVESGVMAKKAPGPVFVFEDKENPHHLASSDIVQLLKRKEPVSRLLEYLKKMVERLEGEEGMDEQEALSIQHQLTIEAILFVGSRSFSHFLNVLERYTELLRKMTESKESRRLTLKSVASFWKNNPQFELIVYEKLMEYRLIDPIDLIQHFFVIKENEEEDGRKGRELRFWDGIRLSIGMVKSRVGIARVKVVRMKKEDEDEMDLVRAAAGNGDNGNDPDGHMTGDKEMEEVPKEGEGLKEGEDTKEIEEPKEGEENTKESESMKEEEMRKLKKIEREKTLESKISELNSEIRELIEVFSEVVKLFGKELEEDDGNEEKEKVEEGMNGKEGWGKWWVEGWTREFCRSFGNEIVEHHEVLIKEVEELNYQKMKKYIELTKEWIENIGKVY
ncbi:MIF4G like-domain-containing protein [Melampsora americana]|nr:MIF4G like-domain-containing protein [Melampsora americana]